MRRMSKAPTPRKPRLRTMDDVPLDGKRVLVRVDMNVSVGADGKVDAAEDYRIETALPTIEELMQRRCKVILVTHRGRPQKNNADIDLTPVHRRLQDLLREEVKRTRTLTGDDVGAIVDGLEPGGVVLLPNIRTDEREENGNSQFAHDLARHADAFVNEAFSVSHRAHASVVGVTEHLQSCAGRRVVMEVAALERLRHNPARPYVALVSGAKIMTKVSLFKDLLQHVDTLCVGGQLANVLLAAQGKHPIEGWFSAEEIEVAQEILKLSSTKLVLPIDVVIGDRSGQGEIKVVSVDAIPADVAWVGDIGPASVKQYLDSCRGAKTVMWNGPLGLFEVPQFAEATRLMAQGLATMSGYRVVGGGDTVNVLEQERLVKKFDHVSVGGGAMIAFLEGTPMPGLIPLYQNG